MIGVVTGRAADDLRAALQAFDQESLGSWIVGEPFLGEDADLEIDRPAVVIDDRLYGLEPAHAYSGINLNLSSHASRAVKNALSERTLSACPHVFDREGFLQRSNALDGADVPANFGRTAIDDARLVQVDVALDESGATQTSLGIKTLCISRYPPLDCDDPAMLHANVEKSLEGAIGETYVADDQVHKLSFRLTPAYSGVSSTPPTAVRVGSIPVSKYRRSRRQPGSRSRVGRSSSRSERQVFLMSKTASTYIALSRLRLPGTNRSSLPTARSSVLRA